LFGFPSYVVSYHVRLGGMLTPNSIGVCALLRLRGEVASVRTVKVPVVEYPYYYPYYYPYQYAYAWSWPYGYAYYW